jgi:hypothetical protein
MTWMSVLSRQLIGQGARQWRIFHGWNAFAAPQAADVLRSPTDIHKTARNASQTEPAKVVAFIVKDKGKPVSQPVASR